MLFILNRKQEVIGIASNSSPLALPYFNDLHTENLEGVNTYTFTVPADHPDAKKLVTNGHIILRDLDQKKILFTIKEITDGYTDFNKQTKEIFCESTAITELLSDIVRPFTRNQASIEQVVEVILNSANAGWQLGNIEYAVASLVKIEEHMTVLEALRYIVNEVYFKEMYFTVELTGTRITKKKINIVEERGKDTHVRFDYGINLRGTSRTENTNELATALIGLGKADSAGNRLTLRSIDAFDDGDVYKETGADWIGSESAFQRYNTGGGHIMGLFVDDEATTVENLLKSTKKELERRKIPYVIYSAAVEDLERYTGYDAKKLRLGDRITIKDDTFEPPIAISGRVMELIRSYNDPTQDSVDLGRYKKLSISTSSDIQKLQRTIKNNEEKWNANVYKVEVVSSNGNIFKQNGISTTLEARVWANDREITLDIPATAFRWRRTSTDTRADEIWNMNHSGGTQKITVTPADVQGRAVFSCEINLD